MTWNRLSSRLEDRQRCLRADWNVDWRKGFEDDDDEDGERIPPWGRRMDRGMDHGMDRDAQRKFEKDQMDLLGENGRFCRNGPLNDACLHCSEF